MKRGITSICVSTSLAASVVLTGCVTSGVHSLEENSASRSENAGQRPGGNVANGADEGLAPAPLDTDLMPGTNHSYAAEAYAYEARDVHNWLHGEKDKAKNYPKNKIAFLTFDDGPSETTPQVLTELKRLGVPATFFVIGGPAGVESSHGPEYLKQTIRDGNAVSIHTYSHKYSELYPSRQANAKHILRDMAKAEDSVRAVLGPDYHSNGYRYPGGHGWRGMSQIDAAMKKQDKYWIDWNSVNGDGTGKKASSTGAGRAQEALSTLNENPNVAVILMHDFRNNQATVDSIEPVVTELQECGYEFGIIG